jgi:uncharacterized protein YqfA (UPF0365 family)
LGTERRATSPPSIIIVLDIFFFVAVALFSLHPVPPTMWISQMAADHEPSSAGR